jgi:hypothetical protein
MITPPLLAMMSGKKVRPRRQRDPVPLEIVLHVHVADLLRAHCLPDWRWTHINRKAKDAREGKIFKTMGAVPGWPDFLLLSPFDSRQVHGLELKRIGKDVEEGSAQDEWRDWCLLHGGKYAVASTMDDVLRAFDAWGCLRVEIHHLSQPCHDTP